MLSSLHTLKKLTNPCEQPAVRHLLSRARRAAVKRGVRPHKKTAATRTELDALLATCDDSLEGLRDRALLCSGFASGGRRRSEIAVAELTDLTRLDVDSYIYGLEHSKTQQAGPTATYTPDKPISGTAAHALTAWLQATGLTDGAIFRRLWKTTVGGSSPPPPWVRSCSGVRRWQGWWVILPAIVCARTLLPKPVAMNRIVGRHGDDRAPIGGERGRVFSDWSCGIEPCSQAPGVNARFVNGVVFPA